MLRTIATKILVAVTTVFCAASIKSSSKINKLEPEYEALSDEQLKAKTAEFRDRFSTRRNLGKFNAGSIRDRA